MRTDSTPPHDPPVDPHLHWLLEQLEPGPIVPEGTSQDAARRVDTAWEAFAERAIAENPSHDVGHIRRQVTSRRSWLTVALACALVALGAGTWMAWSHTSDARSAHTFTAKAGQQMTVRLADGSTMILAPATSATVSGTSVEVNGAAYFTVTPHASRPLTIQTRNAAIQVLGTRFEVRQFPEERVSRVVVEDGRVALQSRERDRGDREDLRTQRAVVSAGMMAEVSDSGVTLTSGIETQTLTGWIRGDLVFDGVPLRVVVAEVGRAYGANVRVTDSVLAAARVSAEVNVSQWSLARVLSMLGEALSAHYVEDGGTFVLVPGRRARTEGFEKNPDHHFPQPERQYGR